MILTKMIYLDKAIITINDYFLDNYYQREMLRILIKKVAI